MTAPPVIAPIVEGHGEVPAVREIVTRMGLELLGGRWIEVAQPFRLDAGKMRKPDELAKAVRIAAARFRGPAESSSCATAMMRMLTARFSSPTCCGLIRI